MKNKNLKIFAQMLAEEIKKPAKIEEQIELPKHEQKSTADQISKYLSNKSKTDALEVNIEKNRWDDPLRPLDQKFVTVKEMNDHYNLFLQRIQQQMSTMGGSGEVNFRYLDDTNRGTMTPDNDNWVLEYDAASGKVQFTDEIGPISIVRFDQTHDVSTHAHVVGELCWDNSDQTLNLFHPQGVVQQIGQELYAYVRNGTSNTIINGTSVQFAGAEQNGTARLLISPMIADGSQPSLYGLGVATQDIGPGEDGRVTVWGKVREVDMSAFNVGDVLYISPETPGGLTNIKPTAPNNVIPIAAVLNNDSEQGEIFVRPSIQQQEYYGRFARTTDQTANTVNTAYPIQFDDTEISNGVAVGTPTSRIVVSESGFYQFDSSLQISASSNKGIVYSWYRKNGTDIPLSSRRTTVTNGDTFTLHTSLQISLDANDYVELIWATSASGIILDSNSTPVIGPSIASVLLSVGQIQL